MEESRGDNYYNVIVDDESPFILRPDTVKGYHMLASGLSRGSHTLELFKRTEWDRGKTVFYGFQIGGDAKLLPKPADKKRKIEFYGNSITAGYAVEDNTGGDSPDGEAIIEAYQDFVSDIRSHYPGSYIICALGNMDATREGSEWPAYVAQAVENLNDSRIFTHFVAYKETPGHPKVSEQQDMADSFIRFIDERISW